MLIAALVMNSVTSGVSVQIPTICDGQFDSGTQEWIAWEDHERFFNLGIGPVAGLEGVPCFSSNLIAPVSGQDTFDWYQEPSPVKESFLSMRTLKDCGLEHSV